MKERTAIDETHRELSKHFSPRRIKIDKYDKVASRNRNDAMLNTTPRQAVRVLVSMFMSGHASPARRWLNLTIKDRDLRGIKEVQEWLHRVEEWMLETLAKSNFYTVSPEVYEDLVTFGTAALIVEEDPRETIRCYVPMIGTYSIAANHKGEVDAIYRDVTMTVEAVVRRFGYERVSRNTRSMYDQGALDKEIQLVHVIEPRDTYDLSKPAVPALRPWRSMWLELKADEDEVLFEGGYHERPHLVPRWSVPAGEVWGVGPGHDALNDCKSLQNLQAFKAKMIHKIADPPLKASDTLARATISLVPGDVTYVPRTDIGTGGLEPLHQVPPQAVGFVVEDIREHEARIRSAFYADQVLSMQLGVQTQQPLTAREVDERHAEKMQQLGSPILRLDREFLSPLIDRLFAIGIRSGAMPAIPDAVMEVAQRKGRVSVTAEFVSPMHQAMKLLGYTNLQELLVVTQQLAAVDQGVLDKINTDRIVEIAADILGVDPEVVHSQEVVNEIRQRRAQQMAAQQQLAAAREAAAAAKDLGAARVSGDSALGQMVGGVSPIAEGDAVS